MTLKGCLEFDEWAAPMIVNVWPFIDHVTQENYEIYNKYPLLYWLYDVKIALKIYSAHLNVSENIQFGLPANLFLEKTNLLHMGNYHWKAYHFSFILILPFKQWVMFS